MIDRRLRFTGDFPPLSILEQFPNWESAVDEEGLEDQDETTIRPAAEQQLMTAEVALTAGVIVQADGTRLPALLEVYDGKIDGVIAHVLGDWGWTIRLLGIPPAWIPITFEWMPKENRPLVVALSDPRIFPLEMESVLLGRNGTCSRVVIPKKA